MKTTYELSEADIREALDGHVARLAGFAQYGKVKVTLTALERRVGPMEHLAGYEFTARVELLEPTTDATEESKTP